VKIQRTITVDRPLAKVFDFMSDFTTTMEWDPGTVRTVRQSGDGGVGTTYLNTSKFAGRETELVYVVEDVTPQRRFALRGENKTLVAHDTMEFSGDDERSTVTYTTDFALKGLIRFVAPLMAPLFTKLGNDAERGMREALSRL
jgi:carbon monoxide dehydrogenase subunit G